MAKADTEVSPDAEASAAPKPEKGTPAPRGQKRPLAGTYGSGGYRPGTSNAGRANLTAAQVERKLEAAQAEYVKGNYSKTIEIARSVAGGNPLRAWRIIGSAACNIKDLRLASDAYRRLDVSGRKYLSSVCSRNGIASLGTQN